MSAKTLLKRVFSHPTELSDPLTRLELTGGVLGSFVMTLMFIMTSMFMSYYYTDVIGISAASAGMIIMTAKWISAFTDIGAGVIISRTRSRHGQARPWILRMILPLGLCVAAAFSVPEKLGDSAKTVYAAFSYILMLAICFPLLQMAGSILGPMQTSHPKSRQMVGIFGSVAAMVAGVLGSLYTQQTTAAMGDTPAAWRSTALILAAVTMVGLTLQFLFTRERTMGGTPPDNPAHPVPFTMALIALLKNKYWILMFFAAFITSADAALAGVSMYYYKFIHYNPSLITIASALSLLPSLFGLAFLPLLTRKFRQRSLILCGLSVRILTYVLNALFPHNLPSFFTCTAIRALFSAPQHAFLGVFLMNTIEYGEWKTGLRTESLNMTLSSFGGKIGSGLGSAAIGWILGMSGYLSNADIQPDSVQPAIIGVFFILPAVLATVLFIILYFYDMEKHYLNIVAELRKRRDA